jgi:hypothetical protein
MAGVIFCGLPSWYPRAVLALYFVLLPPNFYHCYHLLFLLLPAVFVRRFHAKFASRSFCLLAIYPLNHSLLSPLFSANFYCYRLPF